MEYEVETVDVNGSAMEIFIFKPEEEGRHPAVILAQHIPVGHTRIENDEFTLVTAARRASEGYVVAVPFIFHWWPKDEDMMVKAKATRDDWTVSDLKATRQLLDDRNDVERTRLGIVGHCWGGRVAWLGACHLQGLAACGLFYGGRIKLALGEGFPSPISLKLTSAALRCRLYRPPTATILPTQDTF